MRALAFLVLAWLVGGCAVAPLPNRQCNFKLVQFEVDVPAGLSEVPTLPEIIGNAYAQGRTPTFLLLSGGSEHGAFGAGAIEAWGTKRNGLPDFQLVTGVSTGAILASPAFAGDYHFAARRYADVRESQLLTPFARKRNGKIAASSAISVARHGAVADLNPMRTFLAEYLEGDKGFEKIAAKAAAAKLLVGAVDVDSGKMVAFDMTDMAVRIVGAQQSGDGVAAGQLRACYYDAVQASASAPLSATPVFIDNRMYADGGMRYSLFIEKVMEVLGELKAHDPALPPPNLYLILNGSQETDVWCPRGDADLRDCDRLANSALPMRDPPPKWNLLDLGLRSVDILSNQVSRFSVHTIDVENRLLFGSGAQNLRFIRIGPEGKEHIYPRTGGRTCRAHREQDEARDHPLQFHHDYMACMVDYGRAAVERNPRW